jgi:hypothetical protein
MGGEVPTQFEPKVIVVLIGTNDLGAIEACSRNGDDDLAATIGINARCEPPTPVALENGLRGHTHAPMRTHAHTHTHTQTHREREREREREGGGAICGDAVVIAMQSWYVHYNSTFCIGYASHLHTP